MATTFGERLRLAFGNAKQKEIAEKIGVSPQAVINYLAGRIPDAEKLLQIQKVTGCSLDWLLNGAGSQFVTFESKDSQLRKRLRLIAKEQAPLLFSDVEIAGGNIEENALEIITEFFLARAMVGLNLIVDESEVMSAAALKRAKRMPFVANMMPSIEDRMRDIAMTVMHAQRSVDGVQDLGDVDSPFDIRAAVERYDDPVLVMRDWFAHDREPYMPHTLMPSGWARMDLDQKVREIEGLRAIMDRQRKRKNYGSSTITKAS